MNKRLHIVLALMSVLLLMGCDKVNNKEVPSYMVNIDLGTYALWNTYGVAGVGDYRIFDRGKQLPANFPFNINTYTGYGGVLLIMAFDGITASYAPQAYDAACPVENSPNVSIGIDSDKLEAVCPQCHSRYNVLTGMGGPISGVAYTNKYGLRTYRARPTDNGGYIITSK
ncbi:MAG: hypothetical protein J6S96_06950 [Muribaculaceae bacterium]|nr:hypothetical protein [Muribaculaceae bacterium]